MPKQFSAPQDFSKKPRPAIHLYLVQSSQVSGIGYDAETKTLAVRFKFGAGAIYHYPGVEQETHQAFLKAESIGTFFGKHVKHLPFEKYAAEHDDAHKAG